MPLSFREFCQAIGISAKLPTVGIDNIAIGEDTTPLMEVMLYLDELQAALDNYLEVGGFPAAVADYLRAGSVSETTVRTLWDIFAGDVGRWGRDRNTALKLLERVVLNLGGPSSWNALADEMAVGKEHTAKEYVDILADSYLLLVLHLLDLAKKSPAPKKGKKLYPTDPLLWRRPGYIRPGLVSPIPSQVVSTWAHHLGRGLGPDATRVSPAHGVTAMPEHVLVSTAAGCSLNSTRRVFRCP